FAASGELFREEVRAGLQAWWLSCRPLVAVGPNRSGPSRLNLVPWPNPAVVGTTLRYTVPFASTVRLTVHDAAGRSLVPLCQRIEEPGDKSIFWDSRDAAGSRVPAGVYFIRLQAAGEVRTQKLVVGS